MFSDRRNQVCWQHTDFLLAATNGKLLLSIKGCIKIKTPREAFPRKPKNQVSLWHLFNQRLFGKAAQHRCELCLSKRPKWPLLTQCAIQGYGRRTTGLL